MSGSPLPTLIVLSGPAGSGKTTLAHEIARAVGRPAICRDEIKEGMVHAAAPGFLPTAGDELTMRTLPVFFGVLEQLLLAGVTSVADAAFQDKVWRPWLSPLLPLARLRIVQCAADPEVAFGRVVRRRSQNPVRGAHADAAVAEPGGPACGDDGQPAVPVPQRRAARAGAEVRPGGRGTRADLGVVPAHQRVALVVVQAQAVGGAQRRVAFQDAEGR